MKVLIIGAGAAGLAASRQCRDAGFDCEVWERNLSVGGVWLPTADSAIYDSLHTNLSRELMQFEDFPFVEDPDGDGGLFPSHHIVLKYLQDFAQQMDLLRFIKFGYVAVDVRFDAEKTKWRCIGRKVSDGGQTEEHCFDAVMVCNGHYNVPFTPRIEGLEEHFRSLVMHSKNYRSPLQFNGCKSVLVVGGGSSGIDIARELVKVIPTVCLSLKDPAAVGDLGESVDALGLSATITKLPQIKRVLPSGDFLFVDDSVRAFDAVLFCTGYVFDFPFLANSFKDLLSDGFGVHGLFKHIFYIPREHDVMKFGTLSFIGLCFKIDPFPLFDRQAKLVCKLLKGDDLHLPSVEEMREDSRKSNLDGSRKQLVLGYEGQYDYWDWMAALMGDPPIPDSRYKLREDVLTVRRMVLGY